MASLWIHFSYLLGNLWPQTNHWAIFLSFHSIVPTLHTNSSGMAPSMVNKPHGSVVRNTSYDYTRSRVAFVRNGDPLLSRKTLCCLCYSGRLLGYSVLQIGQLVCFSSSYQNGQNDYAWSLFWACSWAGTDNDSI